MKRVSFEISVPIYVSTRKRVVSGGVSEEVYIKDA
jgi:hypothetical protein